MKTPVAFCSISAMDRDLGAAARVAAAAGCDGLEVTARAPHLDPDASPESARAAGEAVRAAGIEVVAFGSYLGRGGRLALAQGAHDVALARALDTRRLRVWAEEPGREGGAPFAECVRLIQETAARAADADIVLVVERHVASWADTPERVERLLDAIDRPNVALNWQPSDLIRPEEIALQPADATRLVPRARYVHLKSYQRHPGDAAAPCLPGGSIREGALDWRAILQAVFAAGYEGPLTIEFLSWAPRPLEEKLADDVAFVREVLGEIAGAAGQV